MEELNVITSQVCEQVISSDKTDDDAQKCETLSGDLCTNVTNDERTKNENLFGVVAEDDNLMDNLNENKEKLEKLSNGQSLEIIPKPLTDEDYSKDNESHTSSGKQYENIAPETDLNLKMSKTEKISNEENSEKLQPEANVNEELQTFKLSDELCEYNISNDKTDGTMQKYENTPGMLSAYMNTTTEQSDNISLKADVGENTSTKHNEDEQSLYENVQQNDTELYDDLSEDILKTECDLYDDITPNSKAKTMTPPPIVARKKEKRPKTKGESSQTKCSKTCKLPINGRAAGILAVIVVLIVLIGSTVLSFVNPNSGRSQEQQLQKKINIEVALSAEYYGTVRLSLDGLEGNLCMDGWNDNSCMAVCRELDYSYGVAAYGLDDTFAEEETFFSGNFSCTGNESSLEQCLPKGHVFNKITTVCSGDKYASCMCSFEEIRAKAELSSGYQGRVEISLASFKGTVCHNGWKDTDCRVVCRQLGRGDGVAVHRAHFGEGSGRIWAESFRCSGSEKSLDQCPHSPWGIHSCDHSQDASCICSKSKTASNTYGVSLTLGTYGYARFSINGYTGSFCNTGGNGVCTLVCKQQNMNYSMSLPMRKTKAKMLALVVCTGRESKIIYCSKHTWGHNICPPRNKGEIYCMCSKTAMDPKVKLSNGQNGIVQLGLGSVWGTVNNLGWDDTDCKVVCAQLLFRYGQQVSNTFFTESRGMVWTRQVRCKGTEEKLEQCPHDGWGSCTGCEHAQDASCACTKYPTFRPRLSLSKGKTGLVKVTVAGIKGGVCSSDSNNHNNCKIICLSLRFKFVSVGIVWSWDAPTRVLKLQCKGVESSIAQCKYAILRSKHDCSYDIACNCA